MSIQCIEQKFSKDILNEINNSLENKLTIDNIKEVIDITNSIDSKFKEELTNKQYTEDKKFYCVLLENNITDRQLIEYLKAMILTNEGYFLFYCKDKMEMN